MGRKHNILIVDDDVALASNLQDILEAEGYSTTVAYDGKTALTLGCQKPFDLAIVDIKLPDMLGVELVDELATVSPENEYVIITAYASLDSAIEAVRRKSILAYETKPLNMDRFVALITRWSVGKRVEEELQRERQKAQRYLDVAGVIILVIDSDQKVSLINNKGCQILGCEEKKVIGKNWFDTFIPERVRDEVRAVFEKLMAGEVEPVEYFENPVLTGSGEERIIAWRNTVLYDEEGGITATLSSGEDITERKRAEQTLRESEEKLQRMFESVTDGITVTDLNAVIIDTNKRVLEMHGFGSRDDVIGKSAFQLIADHDHEKAMDNMQKTLEQGTISSIEYTLLRADGSEFPSELGASVLKDASGNPIGFIAITRDITERKRVEAEKSELEQRVPLTSRLAAVGEMASGVAHEINNPLTTVIGFAHLLMQKDISEDIKSDVENITDGAQRIAGIVERLLTFTRPQERERKYISINDVIKATLAMRAYEMETPDLPLIMADGTLLQQVFLNIIMNADTEMGLAHGRGNLFIKTETIGDTIRISFKDDGPGIVKENLEKIFDPFFTTRKVGEGTGLGLNICHGIVAQYDGQIYAKSRLGRGATFVVELPVVTEAHQLKLAELPAEESRDVTGAKILIIDDEPRILQFMSILLRGEGYKVETLDNAHDALDRLKSKTYDLILLDIKLRGMSGIELYQRTQKIAESIAKSIVFITGDVEGALTRDFLSKTKAQHLAKPFNSEKLKKDIKRILAEKIQRFTV
jgi:PAS domain S-box-containing protein